MWTRTILVFFLIIIFKSASGQYSSSKRTNWTVLEVKDWVTKNKDYSTWKGQILYQGSDTVSHHFTTRVMDDFIWFEIKIKDLKMIEIHPYKGITSSGPLGYYWVDPFNDFIKIKDY